MAAKQLRGVKSKDKDAQKWIKSLTGVAFLPAFWETAWEKKKTKNKKRTGSHVLQFDCSLCWSFRDKLSWRAKWNKKLH